MEVRLLGKLKLYELAKQMDIPSKELVEKAKAISKQNKKIALKMKKIKKQVMQSKTSNQVRKVN